MRLALRPYLATLLLLCLVRTLLPEAWVLTLHPHQHTTEATTARRRGVALASPHHTHCHTEQFYDVAYAAVPPLVLPQPRRRPGYRALAMARRRQCPVVALPRAALRGPPAGVGRPTIWCYYFLG